LPATPPLAASLQHLHALCCPTSRPLDGEPFALSAPDALEILVVRAGLCVRGSGIVECPAEYADLETAWQAQASAGPVQGGLRVVGEHALKTAVLDALIPYRTPTGGIWMANHFRYVTAAPAGDCDE
jgi:hypothetical protein